MGNYISPFANGYLLPSDVGFPDQSSRIGKCSPAERFCGVMLNTVNPFDATQLEDIIILSDDGSVTTFARNAMRMNKKLEIY